jgi:hypothetical protein
LSVGKDAADASARRQRKEAELNAVNNGVAVLPENQNGHRSIAATVEEFLEETGLTKKPKTLERRTRRRCGTSLNPAPSSTWRMSSAVTCLGSRLSFVTKRSNRPAASTTSLRT